MTAPLTTGRLEAFSDGVIALAALALAALVAAHFAHTPRHLRAPRPESVA